MRFPKEGLSQNNIGNNLEIRKSTSQVISKPKKIVLTVLYFWLACSSLTVFLLDLFASVTMPENGVAMSIDRSFINQMMYLSTWATQTILWWAILNLISFIRPDTPKWFSNKNNDTFVMTTSFIVFVIYLATFAQSEANASSSVKVAGMDTPYKIFKSIVEHFVNPVIVIIYFFVLTKKPVAPSKYAKNQSWYILAFFGAWIIVMVIRDALLRQYPDDQIWKYWTPFPYDSFDPWTLNPGIDVVLVLALLFVPYGFENLFNYLGNLSYRDLKKRYPDFY